MGVDAQLVFTLDNIPNRKFMLRCNYIFMESSSFCYTDNRTQPPFRPLEDDYYSYPEGHEYKLSFEVYSLSRYYDEHYPRGPYLEIYSTAEALEVMFKDYGVKVFYSGDCDDDVYAFDKERRMEIMEYFVKHGEEKYRGDNYDLETLSMKVLPEKTGVQ